MNDGKSDAPRFDGSDRPIASEALEAEAAEQGRNDEAPIGKAGAVGEPVGRHVADSAATQGKRAIDHALTQLPPG